MHQIHPDVSLTEMLLRMAAGDLHYHLFEDNITPDRETEIADLNEPGFGLGYVVEIVTAADFTLTGVAAHHGSIAAAPLGFLNQTGQADVYGYYVTDTTDAVLLAVGRFDAAPHVWVTGVPLMVWPVFGDSSQFAS